MTDELKQQQLESLKARADLLGVQYHPNIGFDKLREKIAAAQAGAPEAKNADADQSDTPAVESPRAKAMRLQQEASKLIRIRVTCMNPAKKEWDGEIITAGNAGVGSFKKFVPFNGADEGWHVPNIIFQVLKERQCPVFYTEKTKNGVSVRRSRLIREFAIEELDPLTADELHDLAQRQAMAKSID